MKRFRTSRLLAVGLVTLGAAMAACSDDPAATTPTTSAGDDAGTDGGSTKGPGAGTDAGDDEVPSSPDGGEQADASDEADASDQADGGTETDASLPDAGCKPPAIANMLGSEPCSSQPFGAPAVNFVAVDANGPKTEGGVLPAGIYDAMRGEREAVKGSWRETMVVDGKGNFTRTRQIDTGSGNGVGPETHVSGTYTTKGNEISFTTECADGGKRKPGDVTTLPYGVTTDTCGRASFFFTATGIRVTLTQR